MELIIRTLGVLPGVPPEAFNLAYPLFGHCERCQFNHPKWLTDSRESLGTDFLISFHEGLCFFFTSQSH